jgi:flagellar basal-body rod protein FlgC
MFSALDISTSALVAQRFRLNAISSNLANVSTTRNEAGELEPYQPRFVVFQTDSNVRSPEGAVGVQVASVEVSAREPRYKLQPGHPDAIQHGPKKGYVAYPDINLVQESVDALEATRAYEANVGVIEVTKNINQTTLRILA